MNNFYINDLSKYIEIIILPELIAFSLARLYYYNNLKEISFCKYINSIRKLINIRNINYKLVKNITTNILRNKYNLKIISYYPIKLKFMN